MIKFHTNEPKGGLETGPALIAKILPLVTVMLENNPKISVPSYKGMLDRLSPANEVALTTQSVIA